jgi:release factor glutamine methyltransferase
MLDFYKGNTLRLYELSSFLSSQSILETKSDIFEFISFITGTPYKDIPFHLNDIIVISDEIISHILLLRKRYPLAYISKRRFFYGLEFYVDERVLIPRVETEILVESVLKFCTDDSLSILDICTGSSNILCSLLEYRKMSKGIGLDNRKLALEVAKINVKKFFLQDRANLICADALICDDLFKQQFDIITCNPPYVGTFDAIDKGILYEPPCALFAADDGFFYYKKLLPKALKLCKRGGFVFFEINPQLSCRLRDYSESLGVSINIIKDFSGYERVVFWKNI